MKKVKQVIILFVILIFSACHLFIGGDPDKDPKGIFNSIWTDFYESYALFDVKNIDWYTIYDLFSPQIFSGMTEQELFDVCSAMLKVLNDAHVGLYSPFAVFNSGGIYDKDNIEPFNLEVVKQYLNNGGTSTKDEMFLYGTFITEPTIGYIYIKGFDYGTDNGMTQAQGWTNAIDGIIQSLINTNLLVLDIRGNRGGYNMNMKYLSGYFASVQKNYSKMYTKNGPGKNDFSSPIISSVNTASNNYTKPIVLLTNNQTVSCGELFTLALLTQDHVTHVGTVTCGAFSFKMDRALINGWIYSLSNLKVTDMNDICYEGIGIMPEYEIINSKEDLSAGLDSQLEYARDFFNQSYYEKGVKYGRCY